MGSRLKKILKYLLIGIVLISLSLFIGSLDFNTAMQEIAQIGHRFLWIIMVTTCAYLLGTWSWKVCLESHDKISISQLFAVRQVCETVGLYNPTSIVGGDLLKVHYLKNYTIDSKEAINSVMVSRMTAVLSQILLFLIAMIWLLSSKIQTTLPTSITNGLYVFLTALVILKILLFYWMAKGSPPIEIPVATSRIDKIKRQIVTALHDAKNTFQQNKKVFWISYLLAFLHWVVGSLEFYLILHFLGYEVTIMHGLLLDMSVIIFKSIGAFIPGQLGVEELGNNLMLLAIGISSVSLWLTVSLLRRARQVVWVVISFLLYFYVKKEPSYVKTT